MRRTHGFRPLIVLALLAFVALGVVAVLPHTHDGVLGSHPHTCLVARAQAVMPHLVPAVSVHPIVQPVLGTVLDAAAPWVSQYVVTLPASRAPPVA